MPGLLEGRPQHLVATDYLAKAFFQRVDVEAAREPHGIKEIVGGASGFDLFVKPEPLLRERERHGPFPSPRQDEGLREFHASLPQTPFEQLALLR